jgi:four helix bundle protein
MKDFRKLVVWEKSHKLVIAIYKVTSMFPVEEQYGLVSQMRRAAVSAPTNIAEGCGKHTQLDFAKYLQQAFGSIQEIFKK